MALVIYMKTYFVIYFKHNKERLTCIVFFLNYTTTASQQFHFGYLKHNTIVCSVSLANDGFQKIVNIKQQQNCLKLQFPSTVQTHILYSDNTCINVTGNATLVVLFIFTGSLRSEMGLFVLAYVRSAS